MTCKGIVSEHSDKDGENFDKISLELSFQSSLISDDALLIFLQLRVRNGFVITSEVSLQWVTPQLLKILASLRIHVLAFRVHTAGNAL